MTTITTDYPTEANNDFMEFINQFQTIVSLCREKRQRDEELHNLIRMVEDIECAKNEEISFQKQMHQFLKTSDDDNSSLLTKYINEKEKCRNLNQQVSKFTNYIEELKTNFSKDKEELVKNFEQQLNDLRVELENQKNNYHKKESALYNELQGGQAAAAMEFDEMETKLKNRLAEANQKWRECNNSCNTLRNELMRTKNQIGQMNCILNLKQKECDELQSKLRTLENNFFKAHETNVSDDVALVLKQYENYPVEDDSNHESILTGVKPQGYVESRLNNENVEFKDKKNKTVNKTSNYKTLDLHKKSRTCSDNCNLRNKISDSKISNYKKRLEVPELIPVTPAKESIYVSKRRKLYNVDDIANLCEVD